jgi:hypothetical protein
MLEVIPSCCWPESPCCRESKRTKKLINKLIGFDKAIFILIAATVFLATYDHAQVLPVWKNVIEQLMHMWLYLLISFASVGYARAVGAERIVFRLFSPHPALSIIFASILGAMVPLCSCSVIPLIAVLLRCGFPLAGIMAFWISSPIISIDMFFFTAGTINLEFAVFRMISAIGMGLFSGFSVLLFTKSGYFDDPFKEGYLKNKSIDIVGDAPSFAIWRNTTRLKAAMSEIGRLLPLVIKWIAVAFVLENLMLRYVPQNIFAQYLAQDNAWSIFVGVALGIPAYINSFQALPLVKVMIDAGVSPAVCLAFVLGGAVTSIPAMAAVSGMVKKKVFVWYLGTATIGALLFSYLYMFYRTLR